MEVLVVDSVFYFFVVFAAYGVQILFTFYKDATWEEIPAGWLFAVANVACQHLILNIRRHYRYSFERDASILTL